MSNDCSSPLNIVCVFGTRPEAIKLAPVIRALRATPGVTCRICFSGQHREMGLKALSAFDLEPDIVLDTMVPGQSLASLTSRLLTALDSLYESVRPDWVVVQGDTTTAMAGALAAFYRRIRIAHIEAGLRTGDRSSPFPEEINRVFISRIADVHFPPTEAAAAHLRREGIPDAANIVTGNTVVDAVLWMKSRLPESPPEGLNVSLPRGKRLILVTCHRRESFGKPMEDICEALLALVARFDDLHIVLPVHPNPIVKVMVESKLGNQTAISLIPPLDYLPLLWFMNQAVLILTDSGGIQEEAPSFGKPVLILRTTTERPEAVTSGFAELVGTDPNLIVERASHYLENEKPNKALEHRSSPFGDGRAGEAIAATLIRSSV